MREPPGLLGLAVLDHYAATTPGVYLKWEGRKCYGHGTPPMLAPYACKAPFFPPFE